MINIDSKILISWYKKLNYTMPWRDTRDPYKIWISEIMLQQTQVKTVKNYYNKWIKKLPLVDDVANTNIDTILKLWEGLGYYKRAHNIYESSKIIVKKYNSTIPNNYNDLINLKGIGDYTASAILSIAFNKRYPAVDGNLKRVISRFKTFNTIQLNKSIKKTILNSMNNSNPGEINQALMDLGREICTPTQPKCPLCPLLSNCKAFKTNQIVKYPEKIKTKPKPEFDVIVGMIYKNNNFLISKRKKGGLLGGLWELPGGKKKPKETHLDCLKREIKEELDIKVDIRKKIGKIKHQYSHFNINLIGYECQYKNGSAKPISSDEIKWIKKNKIDNYAFPKSTIKLFSLLGDQI